MYLAEWGFDEYKEIEEKQERYLKSVLGLDSGTPGLIVRGIKKRKAVVAARKAVRYEDKMNKREECKILKECWKEKGNLGRN